MASPSHANKAFVVRSAAILTTGEVAGNTFTLNDAEGSEVTAHISFTLGSLTNTTFRFYVSADGTTFTPLTDQLGVVSKVYTASTEIAIPLKAPGFRHLRISAQGNGTLTSSSATVTLHYLRKGLV